MRVIWRRMLRMIHATSLGVSPSASASLARAASRCRLFFSRAFSRSRARCDLTHSPRPQHTGESPSAWNAYSRPQNSQTLVPIAFSFPGRHAARMRLTMGMPSPLHAHSAHHRDSMVLTPSAQAVSDAMCRDSRLAALRSSLRARRHARRPQQQPVVPCDTNRLPQ
jgi:hypothetical protein